MSEKSKNEITSKAGRVLSDPESSPEEKSVAGSVLSKSDDEISVEVAVKVLTKALREDKDFYFAYQSNIAMAFVDEAIKRNHGGVYNFNEIGNDAAKRFLDLFISEPEK